MKSTKNLSLLSHVLALWQDWGPAGPGPQVEVLTSPWTLPRLQEDRRSWASPGGPAGGEENSARHLFVLESVWPPTPTSGVPCSHSATSLPAGAFGSVARRSTAQHSLLHSSRLTGKGGWTRICALASRWSPATVAASLSAILHEHHG